MRCDRWSVKLGSHYLTRVYIENHVGLAAALNKGLRFCKFSLIARMNADDVSTSHRFEKQYEFTNLHSEVDVLGTQVEEYDDDMTQKIGTRNVPLTHAEILKFAKFRCPINHPTVMFRKKSIEQAGNYPLMHPEDYPLWGKMLNDGFVFANLPDVLVLMRSGSAYNFRRGYSFFIDKLAVIRYLHRIHFITAFEALLSVFVRFFYRVCPSRIKIVLKSLFTS